MIETKNEDNVLSYFRALFEVAKCARADFISASERNMKQYLGTDEIDGSTERATTVRNVTYELIESEISSDVPVAKVESTSYTEWRGANARAIERLCSAIRDALPFEELNDLDERYTYVYGSSVWLVEWDSSYGDGTVAVRCIPPTSFYPQPGITNISDMDFAFITETTTRASLARKYSLGRENAQKLECEYEYGDMGDTDAVCVTVGFFKGDDGEIGRVVFSGDVLLDYQERYYKRKTEICTRCSHSKTECSCGGDGELHEMKYEIVKREDGGESLHSYYTPTRFPIVVRRNAAFDISEMCGSDCEKIRAQQQAINKVESRILQKLLRAGVTPIIPEDSSVALTNSVFGQVIKTKPGESRDSYGTLDTTPDVSQDVAEADRLYEQAKRILGISDALQGVGGTSTESGYARQLKIAQSTSRLEAKRRLKYLAYSELYRLIFEHYLAFADKKRDLSYKDAYGCVRNADFSRYDFIEYDDRGEAYTYDSYLFSVDLNGGGEYSREMLWEKNLENLTSGTLGDKTAPETLLRYWQSQQRAHYPYASDNVEFFLAAIEKKKENERNNA